MGKGFDLELIAEKENRAIKTIRNRISVAIQLGLANKHKNEFFLTELGVSFTKLNPKIDDFLATEQVDVLYSHLKDNPLSSSIY